MSELKAINLNSMGCYNINEPIYLKSEVDRYISELIADQQLELDEWYCRVEHQKYKRCLAMAKACLEKSERMYCEASVAKAQNEITGKEPMDAVVEKFELWGAMASTHRKRWLELAEKFKEGK